MAISKLNANECYRAFKIRKEDLRLVSQSKISDILNKEGCIFRVEISDHFDSLLSKIEHKTLKVCEIGEVKDGIVAGAIKDILFVDKKIDNDSHRLYFGKNITKYHLSDTDIWVNYKPDEMMIQEVKRQGEKRTGLWMRDRKIFDREKIIYRKVGKETIATFGEKGIFYEQTIHSCHITDNEFNHKYILALFNSNVLKFY